MSVQGDIQTFSLSAIGRMIHAERKTGILKVSSRDYTTSIFFKNGDIVFISGDLAEDLSLGALLKADNLISEQHIQKALDVSSKSQKRLGMVLIEEGYVSEENLVKALNMQFKEAISKVLSWTEGDFVYADGIDGHVEDIHLKIDPIRLVAEAERWKEFRTLIPNDQVVFQIKDAVGEHDATAAEGFHDVMLLIDGKRNVAQIIRQTRKSRVAVYRALTSLFVNGIIEREKNRSEDVTKKQMDKTSVILYFLSIIDVVITDLSRELGTRKATFIMDNSLKASPYYGTFLQGLKMGDSINTSLKRIQYLLKDRSKPLTVTELNTGFRDALVQIIKQEHGLLGIKAVQNTLQRISSITATMPPEQKIMADSVIPLLERLFDGSKSAVRTDNIFASTTSENLVGKKRRGTSVPNISKVGGASIIAFYSRITQIIMKDLENNIGTKSHDMLTKILRRSEYYEQFLCGFNAEDTIETNVERIRRHISSEGYRLSKMSFINGFQQILLELLFEERRILGNKATRTSIMRIQKFTSNAKQNDFEPLAEHFFSTLASLNLDRV